MNRDISASVRLTSYPNKTRNSRHRLVQAVAGTDYATADKGIQMLTGTVDFNSITAPGIYNVENGATWHNGPGTDIAGNFYAGSGCVLKVCLEAQYGSTYTSQLLANRNVVAYRTRSPDGTIWSPWAIYYGVPGSLTDGVLLIKSESGVMAAVAGSDYISPSQVQDYVIQQGTNNIWRYQKWNSGKYECWGKTSEMTLTDVGPWGTLYYDRTPRVYYPVGANFVEIPSVFVTRAAPSGSGLYIIQPANQSTGYIDFYVMSPQSGNITVTLDLHVIGRWK